MGFLPFLWIQIRTLILRKRWILPFPVMFFLGYRVINFMNFRSTQYPVAEGLTEPMFSAWDSIFITLGNGDYVVFAFAALFLFLVCDLLPEPGFGQMALLRLRSRRAWWAAKLLALLVAVLVYIFISVVLIVGIVATRYPLSMQWSLQALAEPSTVLIPYKIMGVEGRFIDHMAMSTVVWFSLLLPSLGFFGLGVLMMLVTQLTRRYQSGFAVTLFVLIASYAARFISGEAPGWTRLLIYQHTLLTSYPFPYRGVRFEYSFLYWAVWLVVFGGLGFWLARRQDHLAMASHA